MDTQHAIVGLRRIRDEYADEIDRITREKAMRVNADKLSRFQMRITALDMGIVALTECERLAATLPTSKHKSE